MNYCTQYFGCSTVPDSRLALKAAVVERDAQGYLGREETGFACLLSVS